MRSIQQCTWRLNSGGMLCHVDQETVTDVLRVCTAFFFSVTPLGLLDTEEESTISFDTPVIS
jgi:hypothetical protein